MKQIIQTSVDGKRFNVSKTYCIGQNPFAPNYRYGGMVTDVASGDVARVDVIVGEGYTCTCETQMIIDEACPHALALNNVHKEIREGQARPIILPRVF